MPQKNIQPLGLPKGSIRAIVALNVVIVACQQMLSGAAPTLLLAETLMIVLTHYFTTRQNVQVSKNTPPTPDNTSSELEESPPLWLPRGSIRSLISLAFLITVAMLIRQGRLFDSNVLTLLGPFAAYLLGFLFRSKTPKDPDAKQG